MSLDRGVVHVDSLEEGVQRHVADVLVTVEEEPAEDVDRQHAQPRLDLCMPYTCTARERMHARAHARAHAT